MLNILLIADAVSKIISLVYVWSTRDLKDHDVSCAAATLCQVIIRRYTEVKLLHFLEYKYLIILNGKAKTLMY